MLYFSADSIEYRALTMYAHSIKDFVLRVISNYASKLAVIGSIYGNLVIAFIVNIFCFLSSTNIAISCEISIEVTNMTKNISILNTFYIRVNNFGEHIGDRTIFDTTVIGNSPETIDAEIPDSSIVGFNLEGNISAFAEFIFCSSPRPYLFVREDSAVYRRIYVDWPE